MKHHIPGEIMGRIVGEVTVANAGDTQGETSDIKSLCLVAKSCVPHCQRVLFRSISLQPAIVIQGGSVAQNLDSTTQFSTLMASSPHIGSYVQRLSYMVSEVETPDVGSPGVAFALEQLSNVIEFELLVDEIPMDSPLLWRCKPFKIFDSQHFDDFPRHARALVAILGRPILRSLALKNVELSSWTLIHASGLQTLDLRRSCIMPCSRTAELSNAPIAPRILKLDSDASNGILGTFLRNWGLRKAVGLSLSGIEELWIAAEPPGGPGSGDEQGYAIGPILRGISGLRELHLRDPFPVPSNCEYSASPLENLRATSLESLTKLTYEIRISMLEGDSGIRDPYHGMLKNGVLASLSELEEIDVTVAIEGHIYGLVVDQELRLALGQLDTALHQRAGTGRQAQTLKKVKLTISLNTELTGAWAIHKLIEDIENEVVSQAFPELRRSAHEEGLDLDLLVETDRVPTDLSDEEEFEDDDDDEN